MAQIEEMKKFSLEFFFTLNHSLTLSLPGVYLGSSRQLRGHTRLHCMVTEFSAAVICQM